MRRYDYFFFTHPFGHLGAIDVTFFTLLPLVQVMVIAFFDAVGVAVGVGVGVGLAVGVGVGDAVVTSTLVEALITILGAL